MGCRGLFLSICLFLIVLRLSLFTDQTSGNSSLDTLLALLQAEGAKIEEETEVMSECLSGMRRERERETTG